MWFAKHLSLWEEELFIGGLSSVFLSAGCLPSWNMLVLLKTVVNDIMARGLQRSNLRLSLHMNSPGIIAIHGVANSRIRLSD